MAAYHSLTADEAWEPLPPGEWDAGAAAHLLRRVGFSAGPAAVKEAVAAGLAATLKQCFAGGKLLPIPPELTQFGEKADAELKELRGGGDSLEKRKARAELRNEGRKLFLDYELDWMAHARQPANSALAKMTLCLLDVFVVALPKVRRPEQLAQHVDIVARHSSGPYGTLCKAISRSPAMLLYLDLEQNRRGKPNENFARELLELFMLGEGHYTEHDIKEGARAFTGYRFRGTEFYFARKQHDPGLKTVFGKTGAWTGDDVIDLAMKQPAAATFFPGELLRYYLSSEVKLDEPYLDALGKWWRAEDFKLGALYARVFSSRLFYHPQFRANLIKMPIHYYLGLLQDLGLDVEPFPKPVANYLRSMGQPFMEPPNVRGWVGGRQWISSTTLTARRQLVDRLFRPINPDKLNADDARRLEKAQAAGLGPIRVEPGELRQETAAAPQDAAVDCVRRWLPLTPDAAFTAALAGAIREADAQRQRGRALREVAAALLQSPYYQLC